MHCPSCNASNLKPVQIETGLAAYTCIRCHGYLVGLLPYRVWAESHSASVKQKHPTAVIADDNQKALICPKCNKLMLKYRISAERTNKVDVCHSCDDAWLDDGEWRLLEHLALQDKLTAMFTEPWQKRMRKEISSASTESTFRDKLGSEDYAKLQKAKQWINGHRLREELIRYLLKP